MEVVKTLKPGRNGTKRLVELYGKQLLAVRYRLDRDKQLSYTTVELIIETKPAPTPGLNLTAQRLYQNRQLVPLRIHYDEEDLRRLLLRAGGKWDLEKKVWRIRYGDAIKLGLKDRIIENDGQI
ncbi:hypothetical protein HNE05_07950 [Aquipseudomonas campi]|uniref:Uncharacterized protein n=1 Tax=Aquipseudomonas campi TaxID=2731681 RepID=A0A6M8FTE0_9GAMM|nr:hypothetical protein [Pseudomonas campi]QKE63296.1 hypothetical protein HNE05_07950 [Pseudomonas campi]